MFMDHEIEGHFDRVSWLELVVRFYSVNDCKTSSTWTATFTCVGDISTLICVRVI